MWMHSCRCQAHGRLTHEAKVIEVIRDMAQSLRDQQQGLLSAVLVDPSEVLRNLSVHLATAGLTREAYDIVTFRETIQQEAQDERLLAQVNAGLLLFDACNLLGLDVDRAQQAMSLADWCDVQRLLDESVMVMTKEVMSMSP